MNDNFKDSLNKIVSMKWSEDDFGQSKMKADYKKQLSNILQLDNFNNIHHGGASSMLLVVKLCILQTRTVKRSISFQEKSFLRNQRKKMMKKNIR